MMFCFNGHCLQLQQTTERLSSTQAEFTGCLEEFHQHKKSSDDTIQSLQGEMSALTNEVGGCFVLSIFFLTQLLLCTVFTSVFVQVTILFCGLLLLKLMLFAFFSALDAVRNP